MDEANYIFASRGPRKHSRLPRNGVAATCITTILTVFFAWRTANEGPVWLWFALPFAGLSLAFGPYALWLHNRFLWALRTDGTVILRSAHNFRPSAAEFLLADVEHLAVPNSNANHALRFFDAQDRELGRVSIGGLSPAERTQLLLQMQQHKPDLQLPEFSNYDQSMRLFHKGSRK